MRLQYAPVSPVPSEDAGNSRMIAPVAIGAGIIAVIAVVGLSLDQTFSAIVIGILFCALSIMKPQIGIIATFIYLAILGDTRRFIWVNAGRIEQDPLLFVAPVSVACLCAVALLRRNIGFQTLVSKLVAALLIFMALEIFNPLQGSIQTGFAGGLFYIIPMLWFFVGRAWGTPQFVEKLFYRVVVSISVPAAALGLLQTVLGFLPFEASWIRSAGLQTTSISSSYRPFSFFVSPAEYACYLATALIVILTPLVMKRVRLSLVLVPLLAVGLVLFGGRGPIVYSLLAVVVLWAVQGTRTSIIVVRGIIALFVGVAGILYLANQVQDAHFSKEVDPYVNRQVQGFLKPEDSDAGAHGSMFLDGIVKGITTPSGYGLSAATLASKIDIGSSEVDISNVFISLGVGGGVLYIILVVAVYRQSILNWQRVRSLASLLVIGIITVLLANWLMGSQYSTAAIVWFAIGSMDKSFAGTMAAAIPVAPLFRPARMVARRRPGPFRGQHA
jgi:hypothetical protein